MEYQNDDREYIRPPRPLVDQVPYALYTKTGDLRDTDKHIRMSGTLEDCEREFQSFLPRVGMRTVISLGGFRFTSVLKEIGIECDGAMVQSATYIGDGDKRYKTCELVKSDGERVKFINDKATRTTRYITEDEYARILARR